ncbi:WG repeat-containing protein [Micromonospora sp. WMMD967]|uniref:WG repeat-containing protein n=1 Tax=Micromonospora sp. WMMD967 TaxID=3016101 RepID=UPI002417E2EF|nr:WG repeat-containing protein [Micromonospora sp. WMMD967]MDG4840741.1 WG repeat-containing protein [Micromonospora sp. WMMD967]
MNGRYDDRWPDPNEPSWVVEPTTEWHPQFPGQRYPGDIGALHQPPSRGRATVTGRAEVPPLAPTRPDGTYLGRSWADEPPAEPPPTRSWVDEDAGETPTYGRPRGDLDGATYGRPDTSDSRTYDHEPYRRPLPEPPRRDDRRSPDTDRRTAWSDRRPADERGPAREAAWHRDQPASERYDGRRARPEPADRDRGYLGTPPVSPAPRSDVGWMPEPDDPARRRGTHDRPAAGYERHPGDGYGERPARDRNGRTADDRPADGADRWASVDGRARYRADGYPDRTVDDGRRPERHYRADEAAEAARTPNGGRRHRPEPDMPEQPRRDDDRRRPDTDPHRQQPREAVARAEAYPEWRSREEARPDAYREDGYRDNGRRDDGHRENARRDDGHQENGYREPRPGQRPDGSLPWPPPGPVRPDRTREQSHRTEPYRTAEPHRTTHPNRGEEPARPSRPERPPARPDERQPTAPSRYDERPVRPAATAPATPAPPGRATPVPPVTPERQVSPAPVSPAPISSTAPVSPAAPGRDRPVSAAPVSPASDVPVSGPPAARLRLEYLPAPVDPPHVDERPDVPPTPERRTTTGPAAADRPHPTPPPRYLGPDVGDRPVERRGQEPGPDRRRAGDLAGGSTPTDRRPAPPDFTHSAERPPSPERPYSPERPDSAQRSHAAAQPDSPQRPHTQERPYPPERRDSRQWPTSPERPVAPHGPTAAERPAPAADTRPPVAPPPAWQVQDPPAGRPAPIPTAAAQNSPVEDVELTLPPAPGTPRRYVPPPPSEEPVAPLREPDEVPGTRGPDAWFSPAQPAEPEQNRPSSDRRSSDDESTADDLGLATASDTTDRDMSAPTSPGHPTDEPTGGSTSTDEPGPVSAPPAEPTAGGAPSWADESAGDTPPPIEWAMADGDRPVSGVPAEVTPHHQPAADADHEQVTPVEDADAVEQRPVDEVAAPHEYPWDGVDGPSSTGPADVWRPETTDDDLDEPVSAPPVAAPPASVSALPAPTQPAATAPVSAPPAPPTSVEPVSAPPAPALTAPVSAPPVPVEPVSAPPAPAFTAPVSAPPVSPAPVPATPVSAPPVSAPPASVLPTSAPPLPTPTAPVSAPPAAAEPVSAPPAAAEPDSAAPVSAPPVSAPPMSVAPTSAPPVPISAPPATAVPGPRSGGDDAPVSAPPVEAAPVAARPSLADPGDPEQVLAAYRWRLDPVTLREELTEPDDLRAIRRRLTEKLGSAVDNRARARLLSLRAVTSRILGDLDDALADGRLALTYAEATGELRRTALAQARLAHVLRWRGDFAEADQLFAQANSVELPDRLRAALHEHAGRSCYDQGRLMEACEHFEDALDLRGAGDPELLGRIRVALDAVSVRASAGGFGPYPRGRDEVLDRDRPPLPERDGQLWGYTGPDGDLVVPARYAEVQPFHDGLAWVRRPDTDRWSLINLLGTTVIPPSFRAAHPFSDGLAWVVGDGGWTAIDATGTVQVAPNFAEVRPFRRGLAAVRREGWGAVDRTGRIVVPTRYHGFVTELADGQQVDGFTEEGLAVVDVAGRRGVVDRTGTVLVPPAHPTLVIHPVAFLIANETGRWGALDRRGAALIDPVHRDRAEVLAEIDRLLIDANPVL